MFKVELFLQVFGLTFTITGIIFHLIMTKRNEGDEK